MEIKTEISKKIFTADGTEIHEGDVVVFVAEGREFVGEYKGISKRGALMFHGVMENDGVRYNVMPRSITEIRFADVNIREEKKND